MSCDLDSLERDEGREEYTAEDRAYDEGFRAGLSSAEGKAIRAVRDDIRAALEAWDAWEACDDDSVSVSDLRHAAIEAIEGLREHAVKS